MAGVSREYNLDFNLELYGSHIPILMINNINTAAISFFLQFRITQRYQKIYRTIQGETTIVDDIYMALPYISPLFPIPHEILNPPLHSQEYFRNILSSLMIINIDRNASDNIISHILHLAVDMAAHRNPMNSSCGFMILADLEVMTVELVQEEDEILVQEVDYSAAADHEFDTLMLELEDLMTLGNINININIGASTTGSDSLQKGTWKSAVEGGRLKSEKFNGGELTCAICLEDVLIGREYTKMPCSHGFHNVCIEHWLEKSSTCPTCRYIL